MTKQTNCCISSRCNLYAGLRNGGVSKECLPWLLFPHLKASVCTARISLFIWLNVLLRVVLKIQFPILVSCIVYLVYLVVMYLCSAIEFKCTANKVDTVCLVKRKIKFCFVFSLRLMRQMEKKKNTHSQTSKLSLFEEKKQLSEWCFVKSCMLIPLEMSQVSSVSFSVTHLTFSCLGVKTQQKSKTGQLLPVSNEILSMPKALPAGWRAPFNPSLMPRFKKNPTFLKFSINLDVFWRLQPFTVIGSLWEATTAANYLSVWGRFHVSKMFSHKCTYCAPVSQLFMLLLCHSSMSLHPFQRRGRKEGGERGWER